MSRVGYNAIAKIPADVRKRLDAGEEAPLTLTEWLAIDLASLLAARLGDVGLADARDTLVAAAQSVADDGVMSRLKHIGSAVHAVLCERSDGSDRFAALAAHPNPVLREVAAVSTMADTSLTVAARWRRLKPFAADADMNVKEIAWYALRPWVVKDLASALAQYRRWIKAKDANIRRCAVEGTRPRGVWCQHVTALREEPGLAIDLLEPLRADPSPYVRQAVANWLNDASKDQPDWTLSVTSRWREQSPCSQTQWICKRAERTLRKRGLVE